MPLKTILVPLAGSDDVCDSTALESALNIAKKLNAHVDALHVKLDPRSAAAFVGEGMTSAMIESVINMAEQDGEKRRKSAQELFATTCETMSMVIEDGLSSAKLEQPSGRLVEREGSREDVLLSYGKMFDLIVVCKKANKENTGNDLIINTALLETGRPVIVVDSVLDTEFGRKIAVIWNGSVESSRAITHALPILQRADKVTLISAIDDLDEEINPQEAIRYLELHGITASSIEIHGSSGRTTAESLMQQAVKCEADFLVMGAYTRGRLRRLLFGAVTGEILDNSHLPVLMAH
ncbi:MAG: universal stress protein [Sneathiella sp.]|nr:universal stress protein [Sneathiella sp.]